MVIEWIEVHKSTHDRVKRRKARRAPQWPMQFVKVAINHSGYRWIVGSSSKMGRVFGKDALLPIWRGRR